MRNIGIAVYLAALAKLHPTEYERLVEIQHNVIRLPGRAAVVATVVGMTEISLHEEAERLVDVFPIRKARHGEHALEHGYVYLPSSRQSGLYGPARLHLNVTRYTLDEGRL